MLTKYAALTIYFVILFGIGVLASRRIQSLQDYYVGGKKLGYWIAAFSARATGESGWLILGVTGMGAMMGVSAFWVVLGEVLGVYISWQFMAKKFKRLTDEYEAITIPDYLVGRFGSTTNNLRTVAAIVLSVFVIIYVSAQIDITGKTFETFLGINYYTGAIVGFTIVLTYIFTGGFIAVAWSDFFQGSMMFGGLVLLPLVTVLMIDFPDGIFSKLEMIDPGLLSLWGPAGLTAVNVATIIGLATIGLGFMGSPQVYVRFIAIRNEQEIQKGKWVAVIFTLLTDSAAVFIGILGRVLFTGIGDIPETIFGVGAEKVLPVLVETIMPMALVGLYIGVILAAVMSTIDSLLVVASSAVTRDLYQKVLGKGGNDVKLTSVSRLTTVFMALLALGLSMTVALLSPDRTIFWFAIFGWSGIASTFCPTIILSLFWKGFTEKGAIAAMIGGFVTVPLTKFVLANLDTYGIYFDKIDVMAPAFIVGLVAGYIGSKIDSR
ncbi:MAG: sodium:proline symporter [Candidatus Marinimicrobia bacterium]|nr:sodium:proline symporter [Candidatus Neomarinimicrobiota bacterium]